MLQDYSINNRINRLDPATLFDIAFQHIDTNIIPELKNRTYVVGSKRNQYFEYGNYSKKVIQKLKDGKQHNVLPEKFITFIIPIKDRTERLHIQLANLVAVLDFKQVDCLIVEDESAGGGKSASSDPTGIFPGGKSASSDPTGIFPGGKSASSDPTGNTRAIDGLSQDILNKIRYYKVRTGVSWSRSMLMNFGIAKTTTPLILACDVDFIFPPNFMKYLRKCCVRSDFKKYCIGLALWESHDSFRDEAHRDLLRSAYEPYSACYIYSVKIVKRVGGFDTTIINHGTEERELHKRLQLNGINTIYGHLLFPKAYVVHYSHDNIMRGVARTDRDRDYIMSKNSAIIPFKSDLYIIEVYSPPTENTLVHHTIKV